MALFECVDLLTESKQEAGPDDPTPGTPQFMKEERAWAQWVVECLRSCEYVPDVARTNVPDFQIVTLMKVINRFQLWRDGDEDLISCKMMV